jgi:hypothetical protein
MNAIGDNFARAAYLAGWTDRRDREQPKSPSLASLSDGGKKRAGSPKPKSDLIIRSTSPAPFNPSPAMTPDTLSNLLIMSTNPQPMAAASASSNLPEADTGGSVVNNPPPVDSPLSVRPQPVNPFPSELSYTGSPEESPSGMSPMIIIGLLLVLLFKRE